MLIISIDTNNDKNQNQIILLLFDPHINNISYNIDMSAGNNFIFCSSTT